MTETVRPDSLITLNYRLATADDVELVSTFDSSPATLQLGNGELSPPLESCLHNLSVGERYVFMLEEGQAFGPRNPDLVQRMKRSELPKDIKVEVHALVEFAAPDGSTFSGVIRELDEASALVDFNHPLAGKPVRFEVEVIGVL
jgi:FKBP-type peptidyl-prolyl cis-trans isomerase SlpA